MKPTVTLAEGGPTLEATIAYTRVFTATSYVAELIDANVAGSSVTNTLTVVDTEAGPWTRKLTAPAKGTYRFTVGAGAHTCRVQCSMGGWRLHGNTQTSGPS